MLAFNLFSKNLASPPHTNTYISGLRILYKMINSPISLKKYFKAQLVIADLVEVPVRFTF